MYTESRVEFAEFTMTFLKSVAEKGADSKYQILCKEAYPEYTGPNTCEYNIARSFVKVKQFLSENVSPKIEDWKWGRVHFNQYDSLPWSKTPLRHIFQRNVPWPGNENTVNVSVHFRSQNYGKPVINAMAGVNYKFVNSFDKDPLKDVSLFSIDTGMNESPFQGNFFDFNHRHKSGNLLPMKIGDKLDGTKVETLVLKPAQKK